MLNRGSQDLSDDRARRHEVAQLIEKRPLAMHRVEVLGLGPRQPQPALRDNAKAGFLEAGVDRPGQVASRGIGLEDRQCSLDGHGANIRE